MQQMSTLRAQILQGVNQDITLLLQAHASAQVQASPRNAQHEFLKRLSIIVSHSADPNEVDDWLRTVERELDIAECTQKEKVLYASR